MTGFIFDMDGCLLDSIWLWHEAEQSVLDMVGATLTKAERDELNALTLEEAGQWFHERFGILSSGEEVVSAIVAHMLETYRTKVEPNPGVIDFVQALKAADAPMCVLSSSPQAFLRAGLGHAGLLGFFPAELVISAEDRGWTKRNPDTFAQVCALLGTDPADTWLFDDSWYALATAHEFGLRTVGTYSADGCGTHEELSRYSDKVVDDFIGLKVADFLDCIKRDCP